MEVRELIMVTTANNNKYYHMEELGDGTFLVKYGRVGASEQTAVYPISKWSTKYNEKIRKGYKDVTELRAASARVDPVSKYKPITDAEVRAIVEELMRASRETVRKNYLVSTDAVTQQMVDEAQYILNRLASTDDVREFNDRLLELFEALPRRMGQVNDYLATSRTDFPKILAFEQDLLDNMATQVRQNVIPAKRDDAVDQDALEAAGIKMRPATAKELAIIKKKLGHNASRLDKAFAVETTSTQERFDEFQAKAKQKTDLLWHGSGRANWWSILNTGLLLRPTNVAIHGKMFGYGTYFANSAQKSIGYTDGGYWDSSRGSNGYIYLALFDVAMGRPHDVYQHSSRYYDMNKANLEKLDPGAGCVFAHGGPNCSLRNDEIIVYEECRATVKFLVRLK